MCVCERERETEKMEGSRVRREGRQKCEWVAIRQKGTKQGMKGAMAIAPAS